MNFRLILPLVLIAFIFTGCATGSHVITGKIRPAISPEAVKIYTETPPNSEVIGLINSSNGNLTGQRGMNSVTEKLKSEAAKIGANGVVISAQNNNAWTGAEMSGTAIYTP